MKKLLFTLFLTAFLSLHAERIEILSFFSFESFPVAFAPIKELGWTLHHTYDKNQFYEEICANQHLDAQKIIISSNYGVPSDLFNRVPKEKLVFIMWEPFVADPSYYNGYSRVYTWDDDLIDNEKFFKIYYPYLTPMRDDLPPFEQKKFCAIIASNWTQQRRQIVSFFETKPEEDFDIYGHKNSDSSRYRGPIQGGHAGKEKSAVLKNYKFCICFENSTHLSGYVTEKIFGCFEAGCVPIYWGATNIENYIPKECYIDYRDFQTNEELYQFLKTMSPERHAQYIENILLYLHSEQAQLFSPKKFDEIFYEAVTH